MRDPARDKNLKIMPNLKNHNMALGKKHQEPTKEIRKEEQLTIVIRCIHIIILLRLNILTTRIKSQMLMIHTV